MIEKYSLNENILPNLPTPHDCIIERVSFDDEYLIFKFEKNISRHDSIVYKGANLDSLIIKYHLVDPLFDTYIWKLRTSLSGTEGYVLINNNKLVDLAQNKGLEYLYQYIGYESIIIKLNANHFIMIELNADFIEYEWIENNEWLFYFSFN